MKLSMSAILIFTTLFVVLPYLWFILIGESNSKKNVKRLKDVIKRENVSLNIMEQWNNNLIGIDQSKNILMFVTLINQEVSFLKIDMNQLKSCQIKRQTRNFKKEKKIESELQRVDLELAYISKSETTTLNFYDTNDEFSEDLEMVRGEKWQNLIQQCICNANSNNRAA